MSRRNNAGRRKGGNACSGRQCRVVSSAHTPSAKLISKQSGQGVGAHQLRTTALH